MADIDPRPFKKRRFFAVDESKTNDAANQSSKTTTDSPKTFDLELLKNILGQELDSEDARKLQSASGDDMERAVNMFLDGSWKRPSIPVKEKMPSDDCIKKRREASGGNTKLTKVQARSNTISRYIGAFGVEGWATRSGFNLIQHQDVIRIERTRIKPRAAGRGIGAAARRSDVVVRFTNERGDEIGRLPQNTAEWVSTLIDQKVCSFECCCVYAPDRVRVNDSILLQLKCFLLSTAFSSSAFNLLPSKSNNSDVSNKKADIFEENESAEEKELRLRQVALVKLFSEINLHPTTLNAAAEQRKREGLLQAAEIEERVEKRKEPSSKPGSSTPNSSQRSEDTEDEEGKKVEQDQLDALYKKAQLFDFNTPEMEPANTFDMNLRPYQRQALHWMMMKEQNLKSEHKELSIHPLWEEYTWPLKDVDDKPLPQVPNQEHFYVNPYSGELSLDFPVQEQYCLGGILADEMGLGKTIEMLSLMHTHRADAKDYAAELNNMTLKQLLSAKPSDTVVPAPFTTLLVAPMSLLSQWESEAAKASKEGTLKTLVYYGSEKAANLQAVCGIANAASAPNLIITSYGVVLSEFTQLAQGSGRRGAFGGLFSVEFFRVILDEGHNIKNRLCKTAKACYEISAKHRWVLTGTPIVNRLEDLFSLIRFLRVEPWSNFSFWRTFITVPFESGEFVRALDVVQSVLEPLVLRRTKDMKTPDGAALVPLPPRTITIEEVELSKAERQVYDYILNRAKQTFNENVEAGTLMKSYTTIFAQILRLRQSCCHPLLTRKPEILADEEDENDAADAATGLTNDMDLQELLQRFTTEEGTHDANRYGAHVMQQILSEEENECPICTEEPMINRVVTGCWHSACKNCLLKYIDHQKSNGRQPRCFNCREFINQRDIFEVIRHDSPSKGGASTDSSQQQPQISLCRVSALGSAKICALTTHLLNLRRENPIGKSIVFSQFTSFLSLIEPALDSLHIQWFRFDGTLSQTQRAAVLSEFRAHPTSCVLLTSLRAGGVGLNLTDAQYVFMMDPWWSFAVEAQAIDRVHRMGQTNEVKIVRFVVQGSIESRMLKVQERKRAIAGSLGLISKEELRKRRMEDIMELLS